MGDNVRGITAKPSLAEVREYVLTMLEGLSSLAEDAEDPHTRDRLRDFADHLVMSWSPRRESLLRQDFGRLDPVGAARAVGHPDAPGAAPGEGESGPASGSAGHGFCAQAAKR